MLVTFFLIKKQHYLKKISNKLSNCLEEFLLPMLVTSPAPKTLNSWHLYLKIILKFNVYS